MRCERCGENEANVKYTEVINGVKKQMNLCEKCSQDLGIGNINFNIPIDFSSFLGEFLEDYNTNLLPSFNMENETKCGMCGMTYDEFINTGKFGCEHCYDVFKDRIDPILKKLHSTNIHTGRKALLNNNNKIKNTPKVNKKEEIIKDPLKQLKEDLKKAIKEERYEDAAKIRDEIKKKEQ